MIEELSDEQMELLYSSFTDSELQKILNQEKSLQKRRIVRKIMRNRSNQNEKEKSIMECEAKTSKKQPQRKRDTEIQQMRSLNEVKLPVIKNEKVDKDDDDRTLDELSEQLRSTTRLEERRELRIKIQKLKELNESKCKNSILYSTSQRNDEIKVPQNNEMTKSIVEDKQFKVAINSNTNQKSNFNVMLPNSPIYRYNNNNIQIVDREKINLQNESRISVTEMGQVEMKVHIPLIKSLNPKIIWYFKNRPISQYPNWNFNNKQTIQQQGFASLRFEKVNKRLNEGIYHVEIEDGKVTYIGEFELLVEVKKEEKIMNSTDVSPNKNEPNISATKEMEHKMMITTTNPIFCDNNNTRFYPNNVANPQSIASPKYLNNTLPEHPPTSHLHHSQTVSSTTKSPVNVPKSTTYNKSQPISRVKSMKENFEKSATLNNNSIQPCTRPQININHVIQKPYSYIPSTILTSPTSPTSHTVATKATPTVSNLDIPDGQGRKASQTNIITMVPKLINRVTKARTNIQAYKEEILNFCKSNTEEYQNVNITNFSGSWADGLAFCALIHHFYPNSFNYSELTPRQPFDNFKLAFDTALQEADIDQLLDPFDMIALSTPDWKCVYTYLQSMYTKLRNHPRNVIKEP